MFVPAFGNRFIPVVSGWLPTACSDYFCSRQLQNEKQKLLKFQSCEKMVAENEETTNNGKSKREIKSKKFAKNDL